MDVCFDKHLKNAVGRVFACYSSSCALSLQIEKPGHARETTNSLVGKLTESRRREVERAIGASRATVGNSDSD